MEDRKLTFDEFQSQARRLKCFKVSRNMAPYYLLSGLTAHVGEIANRLKKTLRDGGDYILLPDEVAEQMGHSLWYLTVLADELGLNISEIAEANTAFNFRRWSRLADIEEAAPQTELDADFPPEQRFPETFVANFQSRLEDGLKKTKVVFYPNWPSLDPERQFGDEIDDNSITEDHYRYHDVFHFAYVVFLGWSPVVRGLMRRKRKADASVDRVQDGARARDTEEAVTTFIYSYVSGQSFLETSEHLDTDLLTTVRTLVRNYEVHVRAEKDWEWAILEAARVLRELVARDGGWVLVDRKKRTLAYLGKDAPSVR